MENILQYIQPGLLILIPVLYIIGMFLKKSAAPDKFIPLILLAVGIFAAMLWVIGGGAPIGTAAEIATAIFTALVQGILIAGAAVFANQIYKQVGKDTTIIDSIGSVISDGADQAEAEAAKATNATPGAARPPDQTT